MRADPAEFARQAREFSVLNNGPAPVLELDASAAVETNVMAVICNLFESAVGSPES